ncbi:MAG: TolC family protein [Gammaproteobacteria bacterium]|nr:TolC family protein [Gammaproteobacteria bacterium]MCF6363459.1 TolC family protein [Gammaproteobacteria bacterium]
MRKFFLKPLLLATLLGAAPPAFAAPNLDEAIQAAVQRHPLLQQAAAERALGKGYRQQADSWLGGDPSASLSYYSDQIGSDEGYREMEAGVSLPLWMPGQRDARQNLARAIGEQADASTALLRWQVAGEVLELIWSLRLVASDEELADAQWASARQLEKAVERRVEAGELARADLLMVQQDTLSREVEHENSRMALESAMATWQAYTGLNEVPSLPVDQSPLEKALHISHPRLQREQRRVAQMTARRDDSRRQRQSAPEMTLYAKRDRGSAQDSFGNSLGAEISLPFGSKYSTAPQVAESEAALAQARMGLASAKRSLELKRVQTHQELKRSKKALALAKRQNQLADTRMTMNQRAFDLGESDLFLLLQARSQAAAAARNLTRSHIEYRRAVSRHNHLLGEIPQ